MAEGRRRE